MSAHWGNKGSTMKKIAYSLVLAAGLASAAGAGVVGLVSARVTGLVHGGLRDMVLVKCKVILALVLTLGTLGAGAGLLPAPPPLP